MPEENKNEKAASHQSQSQEQTSDSPVESEADASEQEKEVLDYYRELVEKAQKVAKMDDWSYVSMELDSLGHRWDEGPQYTNTEYEEKGHELYEQFQQIREDFEQRKQDHYEELNQRKQQNLKRKKELLDQLRKIVEQKQWKAEDRVKKIKRQWDKITLLPSDQGHELDKEFNKLLSTFDENKVDYFEEQARQEEENLQGKMLIIDKMEQLAQSIDSEDANWKELHNRFKDLNKQWKKIGKVPKEKRGQVWGRYKRAQEKYHEKKYEYDEIFRKKYDSHLGVKEKLIEEAEELMDYEDLAKAKSKVNKLHHRWKKAGNLPQKKENELWKRFKSAINRFNDKKSDNIELLKQQEEQHYQEKLKLIEEAEEIKDTDDFKRGHDKMQSLMKKWKKIGPAPHQKSEKIWQQFKGAMDHFYDRRREHFKERKKKQKENLKKCEKIIDQLRELGDHDDPIEAVNEAKKLQAEFKDIGYVPIEKKDEVWKKYRKACDVIYDRYRAAKRGEEPTSGGGGKLDPQVRSQIRSKQKKIGKLKKQIKKQEKELIQFKESKTYFSASSEQGNQLQQQIEQKIENAEHELEEKKSRLEELRDEIIDLKEQGDQNGDSDSETSKDVNRESAQKEAAANANNSEDNT